MGGDARASGSTVSDGGRARIPGADADTPLALDLLFAVTPPAIAQLIATDAAWRVRVTTADPRPRAVGNDLLRPGHTRIATEDAARTSGYRAAMRWTVSPARPLRLTDGLVADAQALFTALLQRDDLDGCVVRIPSAESVERAIEHQHVAVCATMPALVWTVATELFGAREGHALVVALRDAVPHSLRAEFANMTDYEAHQLLPVSIGTTVVALAVWRFNEARPSPAAWLSIPGMPVHSGVIRTIAPHLAPLVGLTTPSHWSAWVRRPRSLPAIWSPWGALRDSQWRREAPDIADRCVYSLDPGSRTGTDTCHDITVADCFSAAWIVRDSAPEHLIPAAHACVAPGPTDEATRTHLLDLQRRPTP